MIRIECLFFLHINHNDWVRIDDFDSNPEITVEIDKKMISI